MADRRTTVATAGVVGLALLAGGLALLAVRDSSGSSAVDHATATATVPVASPDASSLTAWSAASATAPSVAAALSGTAVAAVSPTVAWRATVGSCTSGVPSRVLVTTDGGRTWEKTGSPLSDVVTIAATGPARAVVVGHDGSCTLRKRTTTDGGRTWSSPGDVVGLWTHDATAVIPPTGPPASACGGARVLATDGVDATTAFALCADGSVVRTIDSGASYQPRSAVTGATAMGGTPGANEVAVVPDAPGCRGTLVETSGDYAATWSVGVCVRAATSASVGVDVAGRTVWLVSGSRQFVSTDGGASFEAA